jgi:DNA-binding response OmpR family regulator
MWILLIEDEPRIRAFIARGLGAEGFSVDERDDGRLGLRLHARVQRHARQRAETALERSVV